jgi:hypothetical protein
MKLWARPQDDIPEATLKDISQSIINLLLEDIIRTECIDFMWLARTNNITLDEIHNLVPLHVLMDKMNENEELLSGKTKTSIKSNQPMSATNPLQPTKQSKTGGKGSKASHSKAATNVIPNVCCAICKESVSGSRFAVHLEKCMNGGKRGSRRFYESLDYHTTSYKAPKATNPPPNKNLPDPYPDSLIVRIKLKNGVPRGNSKRIGATIEEFDQGVIGVGT